MQRLHFAIFVLRQHTCLDVVQLQLRGDRRCCLGIVTGEHDDAKPKSSQDPNRLGSTGLHRIGDADVAGEALANREIHDRLSLRLQCFHHRRRFGEIDPVLLHELRIAEQYRFAGN